MSAVRPAETFRARACEWGPVTSNQCPEVRRTQSHAVGKAFPTHSCIRRLADFYCRVLPARSSASPLPTLVFCFCSFCCLPVTYAWHPIIPPWAPWLEGPSSIPVEASFQASCCRLLLTAYAAVRGPSFSRFVQLPSVRVMLLGLSLSP